MHDDLLSDFLDDALPPDRVGELLASLTGGSGESAALRDRMTTLQLVKDALAGIEAPDDGYTLRILQRLQNRGPGPR